jgi:CTP synthase
MAASSTRTRVNMRYIESDSVERRGVRCCSRRRCDPGAGRFRRARHRGQDRGGAHARENRIPISASARHAGGGDRVRAQRGRPERCQQHRVRPRHAHPVIALITEWRTAAATSSSAAKPRTSAAPCASVRRSADLAAGTLARELYGRDVISERHRHRYEFNNRYLDRSARTRHGVLRQVDGRQLVEMIELPRPPLVPGLPVPSGVHCRPALTVIRCSVGFVRRPWRTSATGSRARSRHEAAGFRSRPRRRSS